MDSHGPVCPGTPPDIRRGASRGRKPPIDARPQSPPTSRPAGALQGDGLTPVEGRPPRWLRLDLEFDGTDFRGWQRQAEGRTVQGAVEEALARLLGAPHPVVGAGRTDSGVHARAMVASMKTRSDMPVDVLARALDAVLPPDIGVLSVTEAPPGFHARRDARWKWYRYTLLRSRRRRPLDRRWTWHVRGGLDRAALDAGAEALRGTHDFGAFANRGSPRHTTVRTLYAVRWTEDGVGKLHFDVVGDGFLYRMVRSMVGTLVHRARSPVRLGDGTLGCTGSHEGEPGRPTDAVRAVVARLLGGGDRSVAGPVAPAKGLCLMAVGVDPVAAQGSLPPFLLPVVESGGRTSSHGGLP